DEFLVFRCGIYHQCFNDTTVITVESGITVDASCGRIAVQAACPTPDASPSQTRSGSRHLARPRLRGPARPARRGAAGARGKIVDAPARGGAGRLTHAGARGRPPAGCGTRARSATAKRGARAPDDA